MIPRPVVTSQRRIPAKLKDGRTCVALGTPWKIWQIGVEWQTVIIGNKAFPAPASEVVVGKVAVSVPRARLETRGEA